MARISVIIGIYNCASTLPEAIDSILNQTYTDWEMILCDDGSQDETYRIACEYRNRYPEKIVVLKNEKNKGLNYTLNHCLQYAKGEYIARMDGDDISLPERFEKEIRFLDEHPEYDIVGTPMMHFDENGDWGVQKVIQKPEKKDFIKHSPVFLHGTVMIRAEVMKRVGGYTVDKRMLRFEDINLWYKLYAAESRGYNLDEPLYKLRDDKDAAGRRSLKTRLNCVYVTYTGFRMFGFPWYVYGYVLYDLCKHIIKSIVPKKIYQRVHKRRIAK